MRFLATLSGFPFGVFPLVSFRNGLPFTYLTVFTPGRRKFRWGLSAYLIFSPKKRNLNLEFRWGPSRKVDKNRRVPHKGCLRTLAKRCFSLTNPLRGLSGPSLGLKILRGAIKQIPPRFKTNAYNETSSWGIFIDSF